MKLQFMPLSDSPSTIQKNRLKRTIGIRMMMIFVFFCLFSTSSAQDPDNNFDDYWQQYSDIEIDHSALKRCWSMGGKVVPVDTGNPDKGYKCKGSSETWVEDDKQAMDYCSSRIPFHIIEATKAPNEGGVSCTFQINLKCEIGWTQILNKCYKVFSIGMPFEQAKQQCSKDNSALKTKLADYYEGYLGTFFNNMEFSGVWVNVPSLEIEHPGRTWRGALILDDAYIYDVEPGTLMMFEPEEIHGFMCEYTPPMTMAEMYMMAGIYSQIYPIFVTENGASFPSSSYMTIEQVKYAKGSNGVKTEEFGIDHLRERCSSIGNILGVESHPLASIKDEYETVKSFLTNHRFHLTSAYKNGGCQRMSYKDTDFDTNKALSVYPTVQNSAKDNDFCKAFSFSFHQKDRFPTMAAMRAPLLCSLHSFSYEYEPCGPGWVQADRSGTTKFCHYIVTTQVDHDEAKRACLSMNAALSGFEDRNEYDQVLKEIKLAVANTKTLFWEHFWLGGVCPCVEDCSDPSYMASWDLGVSRNTKFLNSFTTKEWDWGKAGDIYITFRQDVQEFHSHNPRDEYGYICGKYPNLSVKKKNIKSING